jgi:alpha-L-arabinofuranosidase
MRNLLAAVLLVMACQTLLARELHVAVTGKDGNDGTAPRPYRTISMAARVAQPGDTVTVHRGVYRECVRPPRGGESGARRIVYQAAAGERVEITGSEAVRDWVRVEADTWKVTLPNRFFGDFNPYSDLIHGDWFDPRGREHHTGAVYWKDEWLTEAPRLEDVLKPAGAARFWFGRVDSEATTIWAQLPGGDPNSQPPEINVRRTVFYPEKPGANFITVRGFVMRNAATPWAPPTAEQVGLIGTHWSKGWIIENNVISHSACAGIALGKYGDQWDNTSANTAEGYVKTIERALQNGWNKETIGHHVVRNNEISHCDQAGIVGSLGAAFSTIAGNTIHDIHVRALFSGAEMAGIKFHAAIDTVIRGNHIFRTCRGVWLDWMAQGTRVSSNLFHDNRGEDLFVEVDHGPFVVDNNLFLSAVNVLDWSEGGAFAHNLMAGKLISRPEPNRMTPYHPAHSTTVAGLSSIQGGDDRFHNNIFIGTGAVPGATHAPPGGRDELRAEGYGLWVYDRRALPLQTGGNVYLNGARPYGREVRPIEAAGGDPLVRLTEEGGRFYLQMSLDRAVLSAETAPVGTAMLGKATVPGLGYESADGSPLKVGADYLGRPRDVSRPSAGPFESPGSGKIRLAVWPRP